MAHITAGDLLPIIQWTENTYGTPTGDPSYYADVAEGGGFTPTDTLNPYISWRYGSRSYNPYNYVNQQLDAGFRASLEVRDVEGWTDIIKYAWGMEGSSISATGYGSLPSRTEAVLVRTGVSAYEGRRYTGCKTDTLSISCDQPGGIVRFEETVLAGNAVQYDTAPGTPSSWLEDAPAVQWVGPMSIQGQGEIYPQSFRLAVSNSLERKRVPGSPAYTGALLEGRREVTLEFDLWMEDLAYFRRATDSAAEHSLIVNFELGSTNAVEVTAVGIVMREGQHSTFVQDKQKETVRLRCDGCYLTPS